MQMDKNKFRSSNIIIAEWKKGIKPWHFMIYMYSAPHTHKHIKITQTPHPPAPSQQGYEQLNIIARLFLKVQYPKISSLLSFSMTHTNDIFPPSHMRQLSYNHLAH